MYHFLTDALKRRMQKELALCVQFLLPEHEDIIQYIQPRYAFDQRPQKGIVIQHGGANPKRLAADNFQGTVVSHVMLSNVGSDRGTSIEWVQEDPVSVRQSDQKFPSDPGVYYIEIFSKDRLKNTLSDQEFQKTLDREGDHNFYFYVDPLLSIEKEPILPVDEGGRDHKVAYLTNSPVREGTVEVWQGPYQMVNAPKITLQAERSLHIGDDIFGLSAGRVHPTVRTDHQEPFKIESGTNDFLRMEINGVGTTISLTDGYQTAAELALEIREHLQTLDLSHDEYDVSTAGEGHIEFQAERSLKFIDPSNSSILDTLGLSAGWVHPRHSGGFFKDDADEDKEVTVTVDGTDYQVRFDSNNLDAAKIGQRLREDTNGTLSVTVDRGGDYSVDHEEGKIEFHRSVPSSQPIRASYKQARPSRGPFGIDKYSSHNEAIPGCVIAFGGQIQDKDKMAIQVHEDRIPTAREFGGRWEISLDLDIITRDPMTRSDLVDTILTYFLGFRKSDLSDEGIELTDISAGGESEEMYEDVDQQPYFLGSISMSFNTDWLIRLPLPLRIETADPHPRSWDLEHAGVEDEDLAPSDVMELTDQQKINLEQSKEAYIVGRSRDFQTIS